MIKLERQLSSCAACENTETVWYWKFLGAELLYSVDIGVGIQDFYAEDWDEVPAFCDCQYKVDPYHFITEAGHLVTCPSLEDMFYECNCGYDLWETIHEQSELVRILDNA